MDCLPNPQHAAAQSSGYCGGAHSQDASDFPIAESFCPQAETVFLVGGKALDGTVNACEPFVAQNTRISSAQPKEIPPPREQIAAAIVMEAYDD
jgi:hypothetical protein